MPAVLLALSLGACVAPPAELGSLGNVELLNRLPPQLGPLPAVGPAVPQAENGIRRYQVPGALALVALGHPGAGQQVPDGPDAAETRVLLERVTSTVVTRVPPTPPFGPWRREADLRVQHEDGPVLRCTVLRRPRGEGAQAQYNCITGVLARYLSVAVTVNHDAMSSQTAQTLAGNVAGQVARMLASGNGLVAPVVVRPVQPKAPVVPGPDDAVPE